MTSPYKRVRLWTWRVLLALDQLANAICGGSEDETLSSRGHKARERWGRERKAQYLWGCALCNTLDAIWKNHCLKSCERDEGKHTRTHA